MVVSWAAPIYAVIAPLSVVVVPARTPVVVGLASAIVVSDGWRPVRVMVAVSWVVSTRAAITVRPVPPILRSDEGDEGNECQYKVPFGMPLLK